MKKIKFFTFSKQDIARHEKNKCKKERQRHKTRGVTYLNTHDYGVDDDSMRMGHKHLLQEINKCKNQLIIKNIFDERDIKNYIQLLIMCHPDTICIHNYTKKNEEFIIQKWENDRWIVYKFDEMNEYYFDYPHLEWRFRKISFDHIIYNYVPKYARPKSPQIFLLDEFLSNTLKIADDQLCENNEAGESDYSADVSNEISDDNIIYDIFDATAHIDKICNVLFFPDKFKEKYIIMEINNNLGHKKFSNLFERKSFMIGLNKSYIIMLDDNMYQIRPHQFEQLYNVWLEYMKTNWKANINILKNLFTFKSENRNLIITYYFNN